jgi:hypothetical protein
VRRHQFGGDRERRRGGKADGKTGQQANDDQVLAALRQRDQQREEVDRRHPEQHDGAAAPVVGNRRGGKSANASRQARGDGEQADLAGSDVQRLFGQHQQRPGHRTIVTVDQSDKP